MKFHPLSLIISKLINDARKNLYKTLTSVYGDSILTFNDLQ